MLMKDVIEGIEEMADKCQRVSDSFILLALVYKPTNTSHFYFIFYKTYQ